MCLLPVNMFFSEPCPTSEVNLPYRNIFEKHSFGRLVFFRKVFHLQQFFGDTLNLEWFWYRLEWQSRTIIHVHVIVKLKNDQGIIYIVARTYTERILKKIKVFDYFLFSFYKEQIGENVLPNPII